MDNEDRSQLSTIHSQLNSVGLRAGYKQTEIGVIPEDWEVEPLETFTSYISYGFTNPMPTVSSGIFMITARDINAGKILLDSARKTSEVAFNKLLTAKSKPKKNDILLTKDGTLGRLAIVGDEKICINQSVAILRPNNKVRPTFFKLLLESTPYQQKMLEDAGGSTIKHIYITIVNRMPVAVPLEITEQTAIANALSDADAWIQSLTRLIAKKRQIKQGAMQDLLSPWEKVNPAMDNGELKMDNEGRSQLSTIHSKLKPGWVVKKLGDISKVGRGRVISHKEINLAVEGKYPVYSSQTTNNGVMGYIDTYDFDGEYVTWTTDGENAGKVFCRSGKFNCTNVCGTIKLSEGDIVFISLLLGTITPKHVSRNLANPKLMNDPVKKIDLPLPPKAEQTRIAAIISSIDAEITALETKLTKAQQIKQGMMQELLTGRIRLI